MKKILMLLFSNIQEGKQFIQDYSNRRIIFESIIEEIQDALIFGLDFITLFKYEKENINHFIYSEGWLLALNKGLKYFESIEDFEKCIEIRDLIIVLKDSFYLE